MKALSNRTMSSLEQSADGNRILIGCSSPLVGEAGISLDYKDVNGVSRNLLVPVTETVTELPSYEEESQLQYRSFFLPEPDAVDTFFLDHVQVTLPLYERQLPKENFNIVVLPTDAPKGGYGWLMNFQIGRASCRERVGQ